MGPTPDDGSREVSVVRVVGELDLASASWVRDRIARAARNPAREVVVDLSGVSFVDCAGLGALLSAQAQLGTRLSLRAPSVAVLKLLELTTLRAAVGPLHVVGSPVGSAAGPRPRPVW
ncbi:MAG TPA: STAS domain-containing protein [Cellulomonas sp.]|uniref:STAS domain-containing protein n=1 Tax=Cellulomonas sp. TaxID=40001 RepID=UPI002E33EF4B|nr:STAS domain-containing protein [Cellulomonas sp.]HEX5332944.1 STAS domain-containing protein [Cellulomonas sp.]